MRAGVFLLPIVACLNILLTSTDSWVSKNPRYLYRALREQGHEVKFVGPYYSSPEIPPVELEDDEVVVTSPKFKEGGDFSHLLPAHQKYFTYIRKLKTLAKGAKKVIAKKDAEAFDSEFNSQELVRYKSLGQDPLNSDFWYVDGTPLESLAVAFSEILPTYLKDFKPDLVIVGPNAGLHFSSMTYSASSKITEEELLLKQNQAEAMVHLAQVHDIRAMAVSMEDHSNIYYQNEDYFNVEETNYHRLFKDNHIARTVKYINDRVLDVVQRVVPDLDSRTSLNINFPSMSDMSSSCFVQNGDGPSFEQVISRTGSTGALGTVVHVPTYKVTEEQIYAGDVQSYKLSDSPGAPTQLTSLEVLRLHELYSRDQKDFSEWNNKEERASVTKCRIAVSVNHISQGNNLGPPVLDLERYL